MPRTDGVILSWNRMRTKVFIYLIQYKLEPYVVWVTYHNDVPLTNMQKLLLLIINPLKGTLMQWTIIQQYGDWYTGCWWVGGYIWYSEKGPGRAAAPPRPLLAVPNVTAHPLKASVPTSCYSIWLYNCVCSLKG